ncbi:hypothetical protein FOZ62_017075, partial [Perkinsus olseni]
DGSVGACEWASERSWSPSRTANVADDTEKPKASAEQTASAETNEAVDVNSAGASSAPAAADAETASQLPVEAVSEVHDYVWKHFQGNGDDERLEIIAEVGQV